MGGQVQPIFLIFIDSVVGLIIAVINELGRFIKN